MNIDKAKEALSALEAEKLKQMERIQIAARKKQEMERRK